MGSSMEFLKVRRMSGSDEEEDDVRLKNVKERERKNVNVQWVAIGGRAAGRVV